MSSLRYRPEVVDDLDDGAKWYDNRKNGLGADFLVECKAALDRIEDNPERVAPDPQGIRSARVSRFPYVIHYRICHHGEYRIDAGRVVGQFQEIVMASKRLDASGWRTSARKCTVE